MSKLHAIKKYLFCTQFLRSKGHDPHYLLLVRQCHLCITLSRVLSYSWHRPWSDCKKNPYKNSLHWFECNLNSLKYLLSWEVQGSMDDNNTPVNSCTIQQRCQYNYLYNQSNTFRFLRQVADILDTVNCRGLNKYLHFVTKWIFRQV